eukprot:491641-Rhodomonas_salina.1
MFAVECAKQMIAQWEKTTSKQREGFSTDLNNHPEMIFNQAGAVINSMVTESNTAVAKIRFNFAIKINRILSGRILTSIFDSDLSKKESREVELLRQILITAEVKDLLAGTVDAEQWELKPHKMIAVCMWAKLVFKYEGIHDFNSTNILKELQAQYQSKANKTLWRQHRMMGFVLSLGLDPEYAIQ